MSSIRPIEVSKEPHRHSECPRAGPESMRSEEVYDRKAGAQSISEFSFRGGTLLVGPLYILVPSATL